MLPATLVSSAQPVSFSAASIAAVETSDIAIGRLPFSSVAASVALPEGNNNRSSHSPTYLAANPQNTAMLPFDGYLPRAQTASLSFGFSSQFLAQLLGQSDTASGLSQFFGGSSTLFIGDPGLLEAYGQVKYMPSHASLPRPQTPAMRFNDIIGKSENAALSAPRIAMEPVAQTASPAVNMPPVAQAVRQADPIHPVISSIPVNTETVKTQRVSTSPRTGIGGAGEKSLIRPRGVDAYLATFSRNHAHKQTPVQPVPLSRVL